MKTLTASQIREANLRAPGTYSKAEHTAAPGFSALRARWWNQLLPNAEQYTDAEIAELESPSRKTPNL